MLDDRKRKSGGGRLARSRTVTVRLDPRVRYLAEVAARSQRRTLSSFIEWAIEASLNQVYLHEASLFNEQNVSVGDEAESLWDVDEADRLVKLALRYPHLLNHDEQLVWKRVKENGYLWRGRDTDDGWEWDVDEKNFIFERLRENWALFNAVARGEADVSALPTLQEEDKRESRTHVEDDMPI